MGDLEFNLELLWHPVIVYESLQADGQDFWICQESLSFCLISLGATGWALETLDRGIGKEVFEACFQRDLGSFLNTASHWSCEL